MYILKDLQSTTYRYILNNDKKYQRNSSNHIDFIFSHSEEFETSLFKLTNFNFPKWNNNKHKLFTINKTSLIKLLYI